MRTDKFFSLGPRPSPLLPSPKFHSSVLGMASDSLDLKWKQILKHFLFHQNKYKTYQKGIHEPFVCNVFDLYVWKLVERDFPQCPCESFYPQSQGRPRGTGTHRGKRRHQQTRPCRDHIYLKHHLNIN